jgi:hypothetical protein
MSEKKKGTALRFNEGKLRYDLVNPQAHRDMVKVLTYGSVKYNDRNWEKGLGWTSVLASLKRHIAAYEAGEDFDPESGELHMAHAACNIHYLNAYYYIFPQGDDRPKNFLNIPKIGLDVDEVLCNFICGWKKRWDIETPEMWYFDRKMTEKFKLMEDNGELVDFYMNLKRKIDPKDLPFEPYCYITSRPINHDTTKQWLDYNGFPQTKVYSLPLKASKVEAAIESGVDVFVDDSFRNFQELNNAGVLCYLFDAPHNQRYDVGHLRIKSLHDLPWFKK